jgi:hypothetical protein
MPLEALLKRYDQLCQQLADITFDFVMSAYRSNQALHINTWRANQILTLSVASELTALCEVTGTPFKPTTAKMCSANKEKTKGLTQRQLVNVIPMCQKFLLELDVMINEAATTYGANHRLSLSLRRVRQLMQKVCSDLEKLLIT